MLSSTEKIIFTWLILATALAFLFPVWQRVRLIRLGRPVNRLNNFGRRLWRMLNRVLLQRCSLRNERVLTGLVHAGLFYSALTFDTMTVHHTLEGILPHFSLFGHGKIGLVVSLMIDVMAIIVLFAAVYLAARRFLFRPQALRTTPVDSALIYFFLIATTLSYLFFEATKILAHPAEKSLSFLGPLVARLLFGQGETFLGATPWFRFSWWLHIIIVYAFIAYVPHSKYFHMFAGPANLLFHREKSPAEQEPMDLEKIEIYGVEKAADFTWKDLLDAFACIECGRCQDVCPAFASQKPLSPKMIIYNLERHLLNLPARKGNLGRDQMPSLMPETITADEIWTCTTCAACMHVCPVEIEHIPKIIGLRQAQVLNESNFPAELNSFFRNLETNANPWGIGFARRGEWAEKEKVPHLRENPEAEYLLFVGCAGSYDELGQAISRSLVRVLRQAGINLAILGEEEKCCGDAARRLGHEYLFQVLARENIELFAKYRVKKILTFCPHGYHTLKYEYPQLISLFSDLPTEDREHLSKIQVFSHLELLTTLMQQGKLKWKETRQKVTLHDSCYYARQHQVIKQPRWLLHSIPGLKFEELPRHGEHSFCCGAGGGLMWTEEKLGERINRLRAKEIASREVETVVTTCPFCLTMVRDGLKDLGKEDISVVEISQLLASALRE